ncbi:MAG: metallophosphoesterase [Dehalococcoidia bacterium]|nr:metallophosphoesterase [Dehalococcoidia bacterium]
MATFLGTRTDVIVCGHSHIQLVRTINSTLLVNPGSPTLPWGRFELGTVGLLETANGEATARIVDLKSL